MCSFTCRSVPSPRFVRALLCALLLSALASPSEVSAGLAGNRIVNGEFDQDLGAWDSDPSIVAAHAPGMDWRDDAGSGSARIARSDAASDPAGIEQCLAVASEELLRISVNVFVPFDQATRTLGVFGVRWWSSADCSDLAPLVEEEPAVIDSDDIGLAGIWVLLSSDLQAPVGAQAVSTLLAVALPEAGEPAGEAFFDAIAVPEPTAPLLATSALLALCGLRTRSPR